MSFDQLIFLGFVGVPLVFTIFGFVRTRRFLREAQRARAVITQRSIHEDEWRYIFGFKDMNGEQVTSNLISWPSTFEIGEVVDILYDPENPRTSISVDNFLRIWAMTILPALSSLMMLLFLILYGLIRI